MCSLIICCVFDFNVLAVFIDVFVIFVRTVVAVDAAVAVCVGSVDGVVVTIDVSSPLSTLLFIIVFVVDADYESSF